MNDRRKRSIMTMAALVLGGACGAGVAMHLYPAWIGVTAAVLIAVFLGVSLHRLKRMGD